MSLDADAAVGGNSAVAIDAGVTTLSSAAAPPAPTHPLPPKIKQRRFANGDKYVGGWQSGLVRGCTIIHENCAALHRIHHSLAAWRSVHFIFRDLRSSHLLKCTSLCTTCLLHCSSLQIPLLLLLPM
jgi:hypothetical protein